MSLQENMAAFLRMFIKQNNLSIAKIQELLNISKNSVYAYSRGKGNPTFSTVEYIAEKLQVSPMEIVMGVYDPDSKNAPGWLLYAVKDIAELSEEDRRQFTELFIKIVELLDKK